MKKYPFLIYYILYFLLVLINLSRIPVAWVDETYLIDPAFHFLKTGHFASFIWPQKSTEQVFLAYLPLTSAIQIINLFFFPKTIFFCRFPFFIFLGLSVYFLWNHYRKNIQLHPFLIFFLLTFFLLDEGITNAMRSGRGEIIIIALLSIIFYRIYAKRNSFITSIFIGLLSIAHPDVWIIVLILLIYQWKISSEIKDKIIHILIISIPLFLYGCLAHFDLNMIYSQLITHGQEHNASAVSGNIFIHQFWNRFLPTYIVQPYMFILYPLCLIYSFIRIIRIRSFMHLLPELCIVFTSIYWIFALAPFFRYTPVLVFFIFLMLPAMMESIKNNIPEYISDRKLRSIGFIFLILISLPFLYRNLIGIIQFRERNPEPVYQWLDNHIGSHEGKILLVDASIAHFYSMNRANTDFTLTYAVQKFKLKDYDAVYYVTQRSAPTESKLIATYHVTNPLSAYLPLPSNTYDNLHLYRILSESGLQKLKRGAH